MSVMAKLLAVRTEVGDIYKDATNPFAKSKYASLSQVLTKINPVLEKHKLSVLIQSQFYRAEVNKEWMQFQVDLYDLEDKDVMSAFYHFQIDVTQKNDVQAIGSTMTYAQRYIYGILFGLAFDNEDPDQHTESNAKPNLYKKAEPAKPVPTTPIKLHVNPQPATFAPKEDSFIDTNQAKALWIIAKDAGHNADSFKECLVNHGVSSSAQIKVSQLKEFEGYLKEPIPQEGEDA
jgi:hypothetical protein